IRSRRAILEGCQGCWWEGSGGRNIASHSLLYHHRRGEIQCLRPPATDVTAEPLLAVFSPTGVANTLPHREIDVDMSLRRQQQTVAQSDEHNRQITEDSQHGSPPTRRDS